MAAAALALVPASGCSSPPTPSAYAANSEHRVNTTTPPGLRARQTLDMLNSDWPIGPVGVATLAAPHRVDDVESTMEALWWDRPFDLHGVDIGASTATLHLVSSYGARQDIRLHTDDAGLVDRFVLETQPPPRISTWQDFDAVLSETGARYSYQVARIDNGHCTPVAGTNTGESLPLASIFKLFVLHALAGAIKSGTVSWDDQLTVTAKSKAVGSSGLELVPGDHVSVRTAAEKMIATSDNMATDLLIGRMGTHAIERALVSAGHHDPGSMTPFPTMYQVFSVGWGKPDLREQWKDASPQERAALLARADSAPYQPDPLRAHTPASNFGAEWYGNAGDICRVHVALQADASGPATPVRAILSAVPGIELDRNVWPYIGAKAGGLPGDLTFSWYAVDKTGQPWVVSFQLTWPRDHGPKVTGWMLQVAKQAFALVAPK
ncbi:serine hydrolase [Mycobacterium sp.]|uniref:serine hydrolase n=1 Tax=Mycobacterium sp. TaxID=1785 RepID=UPI003A839889